MKMHKQKQRQLALQRANEETAVYNWLKRGCACGDNRPVLNWIYSSVGSGNLNGTRTFVGCDGFRMHGWEAPAYKRAAALAATATATGKLYLITAAVMLDAALTWIPGNSSAYSPDDPGRYPDYRAIIPRAFQTTLTCSPSDLRVAVERAEVFARDSADSVQLHFDGERKMLAVTGYSSERGDIQTAIAASGDGQQTVSFDAHYLLDALSGFTHVEMVTLSWTKDGPCMLTSSGDPRRWALIMPMSASWRVDVVREDKALDWAMLPNDSDTIGSLAKGGNKGDGYQFRPMKSNVPREADPHKAKKGDDAGLERSKGLRIVLDAWVSGPGNSILYRWQWPTRDADLADTSGRLPGENELVRLPDPDLYRAVERVLFDLYGPRLRFEDKIALEWEARQTDNEAGAVQARAEYHERWVAYWQAFPPSDAHARAVLGLTAVPWQPPPMSRHYELVTSSYSRHAQYSTSTVTPPPGVSLALNLPGYEFVTTRADLESGLAGQRHYARAVAYRVIDGQRVYTHLDEANQWDLYRRSFRAWLETHAPLPPTLTPRTPKPTRRKQLKRLIAGLERLNS